VTLWTDTLVMLTDLRGENEPREWRLLTWPAQNFYVRQAEYLLVLTDAARVVIAWRGSGTDESPETINDTDAAVRLAKDILRNASDERAGMPSLYGADCTLVVTRVPALNGPPEPARSPVAAAV
jgi:hypothetical protein